MENYRITHNNEQIVVYAKNTRSAANKFSKTLSKSKSKIKYIGSCNYENENGDILKVETESWFK